VASLQSWAGHIAVMYLALVGFRHWILQHIAYSLYWLHCLVSSTKQRCRNLWV